MDETVKNIVKKAVYMAPVMIGFASIQMEQVLPPTMFPAII